jgi:cytochrome b561
MTIKKPDAPFPGSSSGSGSNPGALPALRRYSSTAKTLHWLIVTLLVIQFVTAILLPHIGSKTPLTPLITTHFSFGVIILAVMAIRFVQRLLHPVPLEAADAPPWERAIARATHRVFYLMLLVGPFLGWASASAHNLPVSLFGIVPLPALAALKARWALTAGDVHTYMMWTLLALIVLHVAAALFHHWVRRDGLLRSMLPESRGGLR